MENTVYSYGGGEALFKVFTGVKMLFDSSLSQDLINLMTFVGLAWAAFQGASQTSWTPKLSWLTKYVLITSLFITPTATLYVSDSVTGYRNKVDGLPIGLVLPASIFSGIGFSITQLFDQAFSTVDNNIAYYEYGQSFGAALISQSRNFKIQDSGFRENMESFIDNCMLYDVMIGRKYSASDLKDSANIWKLVSEKASNIRMMNYRDNDKTLGRRLVTCREGAGLLSNYWIKDINKLGERFGATIFGKYGSKMSLPVGATNQEFLGKSFLANVNVVSQLYGKSSSAQDTLKQIMIINAISDIPMSYGAVRAKQQQQESWLISGQLAREILPTLHAVFAALIYASFTLIIGMLVLPSGFKTLANYFGLLIWIETWPPLFAVVNLLTNVSSKTYGGDFTSITMNNASQIISHNNNISVVASGMMIVLPYLSYNILKGGAGQFVHLANQVMGSSQSAAASASNEVASGNRSLDNVSMMNSQWANNSGFKSDMNMSYKSGQREHQLADGTIVKEMADGHKIMQSGPGITHSVGAKSMHMATSNSAQDHQSLSDERANIVSWTTAYDNAEQAAYQKRAELVDRMAASEASGEHYSYSHATGDGKTLNREIGKSKEVHDSHSYNNNQASEMTIKGNIGGSLTKTFGDSNTNSSSAGEQLPQTIWDSVKSGAAATINAGLDLSGSGRAENINTQSLSEDQSASAKASKIETTEDIARAVKDIQFTENQTEEKALADSLVGSYETMQTLRKQIEVSEQKIQRYQTSSDNTQASSYTVTDDMYPKKLDLIAETKDQNGFKIGHEKAKKIMESEEDSNKYDPAFQAKYLPQQRMLSYDFDRDKAAKEHITQTDMKKDYAEVKEKGISAIGATSAIKSDAKEKVEEQHKVAPTIIATNEQKILQNGEQLQKDVSKPEKNRSKFSKTFLGRNKDENNSFIED